MFIILASVLLILYLAFTYYGVIRPGQQGGSEEGEEVQEVQRHVPAGEELIDIESEISQIGNLVQGTDNKVSNHTKVLEKINANLERNGVLSETEHHELQKIAEKTRSIDKTVKTTEVLIKRKINEIKNQQLETEEDDRIAKQLHIQVQEEAAAAAEEEEEPYWIKAAKVSQSEETEEDTKNFVPITNKSEQNVIKVRNNIKLTKNALGNHDNRLRLLEKYVCQLRKETTKNNSLLTDMKNKLQNSVANNKFACAKSEQEQNKQRDQVKKTSCVIKNTDSNNTPTVSCPVCPMYAKTDPAGVCDITRQGFGSIVPANL